MSNAKPILSIAIVVGDQRLHFEDCLRSVLHQNLIEQMEVLVIDCSGASLPPLHGVEHASVRHIQLSDQTTFGEARAAAARQAGAEVIAYIEEHCLALPGWAEALVDAHAGPWAAVGGEIYNANAGTGTSDAIYMLGYTRWFPPTIREETDSLPVHNTSYKRQHLLDFDTELPRLLNAEPILQWRLRRADRQFLLEPRAKIMHVCEPSLRSLGAFFWWNRYLEASRAAAFRWPAWKRALLAVSLPIRPWVRVLKLASSILLQQPRRMWAFVSNLPFILIIEYFACLGLSLGAVAGEGESDARFTELELGHSRNR